MPETDSRVVKLSGRRDFILVATILPTAAALFGFGYTPHKKPVATVQITTDNEVVEIFDLSRDTELTVTGANKGIDHLIVRDSEIWCSGVGYPGRVCMHQDKKHLSSDTIVCLPNKMIVIITGDE